MWFSRRVTSALTSPKFRMTKLPGSIPDISTSRELPTLIRFAPIPRKRVTHHDPSARLGSFDSGSRRTRRLSGRRRSVDLRPWLEGLEDRALLSTISWVGATNNDWDTATNWSPAQVPGVSDDAVINLTSAGTITLSSNKSDSVQSLVTNSNTSLKIVNGSLSLGFGDSTIGGPVEVVSGAALRLYKSDWRWWRLCLVHSRSKILARRQRYPSPVLKTSRRCLGRLRGSPSFTTSTRQAKIRLELGGDGGPPFSARSPEGHPHLRHSSFMSGSCHGLVPGVCSHEQFTETDNQLGAAIASDHEGAALQPKRRQPPTFSAY